jgi:pimeloyl-ACP methyl ester carboxylesterase
VLAIDFRTFGGSGGTPRRLVDPLRQIEDYLAAVAFARGLALPVMLWGTSFSGSAAICAAARMDGIAAVIAQIPWLGGVPVHAPSRLQMARYVMLSLLDMIGFGPLYIRAYGRPGENAFAISEQNGDHPFWRSVPPFENRMAVRGLRHLDAVSARDELPGLKCPVLLVAAMRDDMIAFEELRAARLPGCGSQFLQFDCGHYDPYVAPLFERNLRAQIAFLDAMVGHDSAT